MTNPKLIAIVDQGGQFSVYIIVFIDSIGLPFPEEYIIA